ncbi:MAG: hypothetical protein ACRCVE_07020 [Plesiomonas sp.]
MNKSCTVLILLVFLLCGCDYGDIPKSSAECTEYKDEEDSFKNKGQELFASLLLKSKSTGLEYSNRKSMGSTLGKSADKISNFNTRKYPLEIKKLPDVYDKLSKSYRASYLVIDHNSGNVHLGIAGIGMGDFETGVYRHDPLRYKELDKM